MKKLIIFFAIFLLFSTIVFANSDEGMCVFGWSNMMNFRWGGLFIWAIFLTIILVVFYLIMQSSKSKRYDIPFPDNPIDIIKKRYAKGEINKEDFEKMKKDLES